MDLARLTSLLNIATLIAIMLSMGLQVTLTDVMTSVRQFRLVLLALLANFLAVPLVTLGLLYLFQADPMVSAGFLVLASCPGAPAAPPLTAVAKGSLPIAIGLMVILAGLSAVVSPVLLSWLLAQLGPTGELQVDHLAIVQTLLVAQMLPLGLGLGIRQVAPKFTERVAKPLAGLGNLLLIGLVALILVSQYQTLAAIRLRGWFGMALLLAASLGIGWWCGGTSRAARKAMAITTAVRNAAVGLVIATASFAGTAAVTAVVAYGMVCVFGGLAFAVLIGGTMPNASLTEIGSHD